MKIIKKGEIKVEEIEKKCKKCNTTFSYTPSDVERDRDGDYVNCPVCNAFIAAK